MPTILMDIKVGPLYTLTTGPSVTITATLPTPTANVEFGQTLALEGVLPTLLASIEIARQREITIGGTIVLEASMSMITDREMAISAKVASLVAAMGITSGRGMSVAASLPDLSAAISIVTDQEMVIEATLPSAIMRMIVEDVTDYCGYELRYVR